MNRLPTISLICKPHVAQFLSCRLDKKNGQHYIIEKGAFWSVVKTKLTDDPTKRLKEVPEGYQALKIVLPRNYQKYFFAADSVGSCLEDTEEFFWNGAISFISVYRANNKCSKEDAIKAFYNEFELYESIYPYENMRKQLYRKGVFVDRNKVKINTISRLFSDEEAKKIATLFHTKKASSREIAKKFNISHQYVVNLHNKVYN